jgi:hypothetical protein
MHGTVYGAAVELVSAFLRQGNSRKPNRDLKAAVANGTFGLGLS